MPHQEKALSFLREKAFCAGLFLAPGTGKTIIAIRSSLEYLPALVICRRDDFLTWHKELTEEGYVLGEIMSILSASSIKNLELVYCWTLVTYDMLKNKHVYNYITGRNYGIVFCDESQAIKHWTSRRTKVVYKATRHIPRRIAMTGTPISNEILDVYSQCLFIDNGITFGTNAWKFRNNYYIQSGPGWYPKKEAKRIVAEKLKTISFHVHEDDVLNLPPIRNVMKAVALSQEQKKHYTSVLNDWELELASDSKIDINYIIVRLAKLKQIASGFVYIDHKPVFFRENKIPLLLELLQSKDHLARKQKIVIWASYKAELYRISRNFQKHDLCHVVYHGSMSTDDKNATRELFRDDPHCRVFVGQADAGVGMNELTVADTAIYMSNSFKIASRQQSERRIRRYGSENHSAITYYDIVTERTVDLPILNSIRKGMDIAKEILDSVKQTGSIKKALDIHTSL